MLTIEDAIKYGFMLVGFVFSLGSTYALIRSDIKGMVDKFAQIGRDISRVEASTNKAHERIDSHITVYHKPN